MIPGFAYGSLYYLDKSGVYYRNPQDTNSWFRWDPQRQMWCFTVIVSGPLPEWRHVHRPSALDTWRPSWAVLGRCAGGQEQTSQ